MPGLMQYPTDLALMVFRRTVENRSEKKKEPQEDSNNVAQDQPWDTVATCAISTRKEESRTFTLTCAGATDLT